MRLWGMGVASMGWHLSIPSMNNYNRTEADIFPQNKWICWKCVVRKFGFVHERFDPLSCNSQIKSLTTVDIFSWLCGPDVTHPPGVRDVPGSTLGSGKDFYILFCCCCCCCVLHVCPNHIICREILQFF